MSEEIVRCYRFKIHTKKTGNIFPRITIKYFFVISDIKKNYDYNTQMMEIMKELESVAESLDNQNIALQVEYKK